MSRRSRVISAVQSLSVRFQPFLESGRCRHLGLITAESRVHNAASGDVWGSSSETRRWDRDFDLSLFALSGVDIPPGPLKLVGNGAVDLG